MKQSRTFVLFLVFLLAVLHVVPISAQYSQTKCQPKKKFWNNKETRKWFAYKEPKQRKEKKDKVVVLKPQKDKAVVQHQKRRKARKDKRYVKRLRAIKRKGKVVASSTQCPH